MNTAKVIKKKQKACEIIIEMNQVILFLLILNQVLKTSITGNTYNNVDLTIIGDDGNPVPHPDYDANKAGTKETEVVIPLKH